MINEKEIMIGGCFQHNANWCHRSPSEIKPFTFQWEARDWYALGECTMSLDDCEPIPLTPEILSKLEFDGGCKRLSNRITLEWSFGSEFWICMDGDVVFTIEDTNNLHQLQNLFRSLTGEELDVTKILEK